METASEVVVVTGGSGFLGQHVVKQLHEDPAVREIRVLDVKPYVNKLVHVTRVPVIWLCGDLTDECACAAAFHQADVVIHCAGLIDRRLPADEEALHRNNVRATEVVVSLCRKFNVPRLVVTSTLEVVLVPYLPSFSLLINTTEARAPPPGCSDPGSGPGPLTAYAASKLRAERVALAANGATLSNGGTLRTVALRPPLMYGEEDRRLVPGLLRLARFWDPKGRTLLQLGGANNRQQHAYVGNVAWAHVCAKRALLWESQPENVPPAQAVAGLPVFITDDTPKGDVLRLSQLLLTFPDVSGQGARSLLSVRPSLLPPWAWFAGAVLAEAALGLLRASVPLSPRALVRYLGSVVMVSRLRAETRLHYTPKFDPEVSIARSRAYYARSKDLTD